MPYKLLPHQEEMLKLQYKVPWLLNASAPGVGKTLPQIAMAVENPTKSMLVVCPAYLIRNWVREFKRFGDIDAAIYPKTSRVTIVSVDAAWKAEAVFKQANILCVDEAHFLGNMEARRTDAIHKYIAKFLPERLILLSGTPMKNRIGELYSLLMLLHYQPTNRKRGFWEAYPKSWNFKEAFMHKKQVNFGKRRTFLFQGSKNLDVLKQWLDPLMIRYELSDIADMPDLVEEVVSCVTWENDIDFVTEMMTDEVLETGWQGMAQFGGEPPQHVSSAKKHSAILKVPFTAEYAANLLKNEQDGLLIFSDHIDSTKLLCANLQKRGFKADFITGGTPLGIRDTLQQRFQNKEIDVLCGTIGSMGTGVTLTRTNVAIFNDRSYVPANNMQAIKRILRIGQNKPCLQVSICREGVDERINRMLIEKEKVIDETIQAKRTI